MDIHVRTQGRYGYSYISSAAVMLDDNIVEVDSFGDYFLNGIDNAELPAKFGGFTVTHTQPSEKKHVFTIDLGDGENFVISTFKDMV